MTYFGYRFGVINIGTEDCCADESEGYGEGLNEASHTCYDKWSIDKETVEPGLCI